MKDSNLPVEHLTVTGKYHEIGYLFYITIGKMKSPKCISHHHAQAEENNFNELDKMC